MNNRPRRSLENTPPLSFRERFAALGNLPGFFRLVWRTSPGLALSNALLRLVRGGLPMVILWLGKLIIDELVLQMAQPSPNLERLWWLVGAELGFAVFNEALGRGIAYTDGLLGDLVANSTSIAIMEHAASLDLAQFEDATFYDKLERARQQTVGRTVLLSQTLAQVQDLISLVALAIGLAAFNPWLILLLVITVVPAFLSEAHFNARSYSLTQGWTPERRELDYLRFTGASDETAKEVKLFGLSNFLTDRFRLLSDQYYRANRHLTASRAGWGGLFAAVGTAGYYGAYVFILYQTVQGLITLGTLTFLAGSFRQLRVLLEGILMRLTGIAQGALYLKDLFDFYQIKPRITSPGQARPLPQPIQQGFVFENVGFKYPNSERWANRGLSFTLAAGEKLALVGENGAGKTTLVKLLARLYDPDEGRILLDGHDLREYDLMELRQSIGVIFQDFVKFQMTAAANIAVGRINDRHDQPRIEHSAGQSLANTVIDRLPERYEQMLGRRFAKGVDLSGGEWQKVALGRAYMRDAQVLILDEPTAALDARAEYEVFQRFAELTQGKTAVLISHRFSTVRMADRILVLEGGTFVEIGSHDELLTANGRYAELFRLQARGYQ